MNEIAEAAARMRRSGRRAFAVMRRRDWLLVTAACTAALLLFTTLLVAQLDAYRARSQAAAQAHAQASIVADQRAAQSRRIDLLSTQLDDTREQLRAQATLVGRQEQAIRDLSAQVDAMGGEPVTSSVAAHRDATRTARPTTAPTGPPATRTKRPSTPKRATPTTGPTATPPRQPQPAPTTTQPHDDGPLGLCALLPLC